MKDKRIYSLDLLRIFAMCGIIGIHLLGQGGILASSVPGSFEYWMEWFLRICFCTSVDVFALLSGYLGYGKKRLNSYRVFELISVVIFYCCIITVVSYIFVPSIFKNGKDIIKSLCPMLVGRYWYITCYIPVALVSPFLNYFTEKLSLKNFRKMVLIIFLIFVLIPSVFNIEYFGLNRGISFVWLLFCYIFGSYLRCETFRFKHNYFNLIIFFCASIFLLVLNLCIYMIAGKNIEYMIMYTSPVILIMAMSITVYMANKELDLTSKIIKTVLTNISNCAFDVYIIHCHLVIYDYFIKDNFIFVNNYNFIVRFLLVNFIIFLIYILISGIGYMRSKLFELLRVKQIFIKLTRNKLSYSVE